MAEENPKTGFCNQLSLIGDKGKKNSILGWRGKAEKASLHGASTQRRGSGLCAGERVEIGQEVQIFGGTYPCRLISKREATLPEEKYFRA